MISQVCETRSAMWKSLPFQQLDSCQWLAFTLQFYCGEKRVCTTQMLAPFGDQWEAWWRSSKGLTCEVCRAPLHTSGQPRRAAALALQLNSQGKKRSDPLRHHAEHGCAPCEMAMKVDGEAKNSPHVLINSWTQFLRIAYLAEWMRFAIWDLSNQLCPVQTITQHECWSYSI